MTDFFLLVLICDFWKSNDYFEGKLMHTSTGRDRILHHSCSDWDKHTGNGEKYGLFGQKNAVFLTFALFWRCKEIIFI